MIELEPAVLQNIRASLPDTQRYNTFDRAILSEVREAGRDPSCLTAKEFYDIGRHIGEYICTDVDGWLGLRKVDVPDVSQLAAENDLVAGLEPHINEFRDALHRCVEDLHIEEDAKRVINGYLDQAYIDLRHPDPWKSYADFRDGHIYVNLHAGYMGIMARTMEEVFRQPTTANTDHVVVARHTAHEEAHGLDMALRHFLKLSDSPSLLYGDAYMGDFPYVWKRSSYTHADMMHPILEWAKQERFADYFSWAVIRGLHYPENILVDMARIHLESPFQTGLTLGQMRLVIEGAKHEIDMGFGQLPADEQVKRTHIVTLMLIDTFENPGIPLLYPFSRGTVETIINTAWRAGLR